MEVSVATLDQWHTGGCDGNMERRTRANLVTTNNYKFKLGHIDSPESLACGCAQNIEHILCSWAGSYKHQQQLEKNLNLLDKPLL